MGRELVGGEYVDQVQIVTSDGTVVDSFGGSGGESGALTNTQLRAAPLEVTGELTIEGGLTDTELRAADVKVTLDGESVAVTGPLTDAQLRAALVPVRTDPTSVTSLYDSGRTAAVTAASALKVDGSAVTQPVSGTVEITNDAGNAIPVSGTFYQATQPVSGPLTDSQLRATAVPVSGTVTASGPLTDAQLRATAVPVSGTFYQATQPASIAAGSDVTEGNTSDAAVITDTTGTLSGKLRGLVKWAFERMPASLGQKAKAASLPVVLPSDQDAIPVTGTFWQATQPVSGTITANLGATDNTVLDEINAHLADIETAVESTTASAVTDSGPAWTSVWTCTTSADASGTVDCTAAPTSGQKIVVDDIILSVGATAQTVTFEEETSGTDLMVLYMPANSTVQITPRGKLKLATADKKLRLDTSASGAVSCTVTYHSEA